VVAQITEGTAFDKHGRPFRRRNYLPGILVLAALATVTAIIWSVALTRPADVHEAAPCNPPQSGADTVSLGQQVSPSEMAEVEPARLADARIRVLNASGRAGQAADVATELRELGFPDPGADNDPVYADTRLICQGQIRFGPAGRAAAAAVWLVAPCTELYQDGRPDDTVDLALGTEFTSLSRGDDTEAALAGLRQDATEPPDPDLLAKLHSSC
jgi:hypothetical protein